LADWERKAHESLISEEGLARIGELRRRSHKVRQVTAENESVQEQEKRALEDVKEGFEAWLKAGLDVAASQFGNDDNIEATAGEIGDTGKEYRLSAVSANRAYAPVTALELRLRLAEDNFQRLHRLRVQLCKGPKARVTIRESGFRPSQPEPAARVVQDEPLAMIPVYFQTVFGQGQNARANSQPSLAGFLIKKAAQGTVPAEMPPHRGTARAVTVEHVRKVGRSSPTLNALITRTFHPEISQCTSFRVSEWLTAREALQAGLMEAIDTFIDFVVSGATRVGA
jgi:hypothetical protein